MPRQSLARVEIARARLFDLDADRKKWIDDVIDYFGSGRIDATRDPCGESLLDDDVLHTGPPDEIVVGGRHAGGDLPTLA